MATPTQLTLFDMRPICPGCKRPALPLGEWSPGERTYLCRECTLRLPAPDVFVPHDNRVGAGLRQEPGYAAQREDYHRKVDVLLELRKGCIHTLDDLDDSLSLPCMYNDLYLAATYGAARAFRRDIQCETWAGCKRCKNRLRYAAHQLGQVAKTRAMLRDRHGMQVSLPVCTCCGSSHDNRYSDGQLKDTCQPCEDKATVEAFWRNKGIFGGDDVENIMDRIQRSHPHLFERDILPDYWFKLMIESR